MRLEWLDYLQKVVEFGSMNKAAEVLFCSQPTISNAIKAIEQELGGPVLERTANGTVPTVLGKMVLQDTPLILGYVERWKLQAKKEREDSAISLLLTGTAPRYYLIKCIMKMKQELSSWDISLVYAPLSPGKSPFSSRVGNEAARFRISYKIPEHISEARIDSEQHGMRLAILQQDEFWLFCNAKNDLAARGSELTWESIRGRDVLLYQNPKAFPYLKELLEIDCRIGPQMWHEENIMLALALDEKAVAFRPKNTADHNSYMDGGFIKMFPVRDFHMPVSLCLFFPSAERITSAEARFLERFSKFFPEFEIL